MPQAANPYQASITPELKTWIAAQAKAGVSAPKVLQAMLDAGWHEEVALAALETVLGIDLAALQAVLEQALGPAGAAARSAERLPRAVATPEIALDNHPAWIDVGDRQVRVLMHLRLPRVVVLDGLLTPAECDEIIALAKPHMRRSLTVDNQSEEGGDSLNASRTSDGMFFDRGQAPVISALEARISRLLNWPVENGEGLQVLRYGPGAEYRPHYDYFELGQPSTEALLSRGGQRVGTLLIYLNTPPEGGGTTFPDAGLEITAQQGMAVFFSYDRAHPSTLSLHGGAPVISGEKWVATKWLRERVFQ
ncbi:MAG: 2OG-Fe(II) oxygenase [Comamonadaceae bacterium]|nr:2OG-Fe(II) oxygenase [Comamonadaceae bacterium]